MPARSRDRVAVYVGDADYPDSYRPAVEVVLRLDVRGEAPIVLADGAELGRFLDLLRADPGEPSRLAGTGAAMHALLPVDPVPDEPDWMRAEELLEGAPACPGERLFAQSLASAAQWRSAGEIAAAAHALAAAIEAGIPLPGSFAPEAVRRGCVSVEVAAARFPAARRARLLRA